MSETTLRVGKRGEIYTTRRIRERTGLAPGGMVVAKVEEKALILRPKPTAISLLKEPRANAKPISLEELSGLRRELAKRLETR